MNVASIQIYRVAMPLVYPFRTAFGDNDVIESILVAMSDGQHTGWGESASWGAPAYSPECAPAQFLVSRDFIAPALIGQEIASGEALQYQLRHIKGNFFAKGAFDLAWWDLHARIQGVPLWRLIRGQGAVVDAGADFGIMESIDALLDAMDEAVEQGYKRVKLKYRPGWELEMIRRVRKRFPHLTIHIDCNSAYTLNDIDMFRELDQYDLVMIEQPLAYDDLLDHARLQSQIQTPICLDESITSVDKARKAIEIDAARWVNIKLGPVGGLTNAIAIHNLCQDHGIPCWVGGMLESAIGQWHSMALAALPNIHYPSDIFPSSRFYRHDLAEPIIEHSGPSQFQLLDAPGIGATPRPDLLREFTVERCVVQ